MRSLVCDTYINLGKNVDGTTKIDRVVYIKESC